MKELLRISVIEALSLAHIMSVDFVACESTYTCDSLSLSSRKLSHDFCARFVLPGIYLSGIVL